MSGGGGDQVVGHRYYMSLHMGICRGPVDALVEIRVADRKAWPLPVTTANPGTGIFSAILTAVDPETGGTYTSGTMVDGGPIEYTTTPAPSPITVSTAQVPIEARTLFGGDKREGGIQGKLDVMMGEDTQEVNPRLAAMLGGSLVSAFRGMFTLFFDGLVTSMNPYPKPWKFRVRRALQGWDGDVLYPATCVVNLTVNEPEVKGGPIVARPIKAMNPAHIIWECITNRDWGRGLSPSMLDEGSFTAAAGTLFSEGFGLCLKWTREDTVDAFVQMVIDHIGAVLYVSRATGLITLKLVRDDYDIEDLPVFTTSTGILRVEDDDSSTANTLINEIIIKYDYPLDGQERLVRIQNIAGIQSSGSILSKTVRYPGIPTPSLAQRVAQRDLRIHGTALRRFKLTMDRRGNSLTPGSVFVLNDTKRSITNLVLRVGRVEDAVNGEIPIVAVQDVFALDATSYVEPQVSTGGGDQEPTDVSVARVEEAAYMDVFRMLPAADFANLTGDECYIFMLGVRPSSSTQYDVYSGNSSIGFDVRAVGAWAPAASLGEPITPLQDTFQIDPISLPDTVSVLMPVMIGGERMRVNSYDSATQTLVVARGCGDTIPRAHSLGEAVLFYAEGSGTDGRVYADTEDVTAKFLTTTPVGTLHESLATAFTLTMANRVARPYPPAQVRVDTDYFCDAVITGPDFDLTWVHRNRLTQSDVLVSFNEPNVTPETGQTATVIVRLPDGTAVRTDTGITGGSWSYTSGNYATDGSPTVAQFELFSVRDGYDSWEKYKLPVNFDTPDTSAHEYWRLLVTSVNGNADLVVALAEVEMRGSSAGPDLCDVAGGTIAASSEWGGTALAINAFDDDPDSPSFWQSANQAGPDMTEEWLSHQFATAQTINAVALTIREEEGEIDTAPVNFQVQYSDDGVAWVTAWVVFDAVWTTPGQTQVFSR